MFKKHHFSYIVKYLSVGNHKQIERRAMQDNILDTYKRSIIK